jgi:hypothetical protein
LSNPLREAMPTVAAFIDECREAFGVECVNNAIKLGMQGAETFYASENGHQVGTKSREPLKSITLDKMVLLSREEKIEKERRRR